MCLAQFSSDMNYFYLFFDFTINLLSSHTRYTHRLSWRQKPHWISSTSPLKLNVFITRPKPGIYSRSRAGNISSGNDPSRLEGKVLTFLKFQRKFLIPLKLSLSRLLALKLKQKFKHPQMCFPQTARLVEVCGFYFLSSFRLVSCAFSCVICSKTRKYLLDDWILSNSRECNMWQSLAE